MKQFISKVKNTLLGNATALAKKAISKIKEKDGVSGEYVIVIIIGIVIAIILGGIAITYFKDELPKWLEQVSGKVGGFFDMI